MARDPSRKYHDRVAGRYDAIYDDPYWAFHDELTWKLIKPHLPRDAAAPCLDLGCGTGKWGLKLLKSGFPTTFVDHSAKMIGQVLTKLEGNPRARKATTMVADIVSMPELPAGRFALTLAMGDPLSICSDAAAAAREMFRASRPGGIVIATADSKPAAFEHYIQRGSLDALEQFVKTGRTHWLTADERERFELTTFTPTGLRKLFESAGFEVISLVGKPVMNVRSNRQLLEQPDAIERLVRLELELMKDPSTAGSAGHLQITARRKPDA